MIKALDSEIIEPIDDEGALATEIERRRLQEERFQRPLIDRQTKSPPPEVRRPPTLALRLQPASEFIMAALGEEMKLLCRSWTRLASLHIPLESASILLLRLFFLSRCRSSPTPTSSPISRPAVGCHEPNYRHLVSTMDFLGPNSYTNWKLTPPYSSNHYLSISLVRRTSFLLSFTACLL